jgi:hypothetical protein
MSTRPFLEAPTFGHFARSHHHWEAGQCGRSDPPSHVLFTFTAGLSKTSTFVRSALARNLMVMTGLVTRKSVRLRATSVRRSTADTMHAIDTLR